MKRAPLPIRTHSNIAATLNATFNTGTRYFATPTEAPLTVICINGSPPVRGPRRSSERTSATPMELSAIFRKCKGEFRFQSGSAREQIWNVLCGYPKGMTIAQLRDKLPTLPGIVAALQKLVACGKVEAV